MKSSILGDDSQSEDGGGLPFSLLPLLIVQSLDFKDAACETTKNMNIIYAQYLKNKEIDDHHVEVSEESHRICQYFGVPGNGSIGH